MKLAILLTGFVALMVLNLIACTFEIKPVIEVYDASLNIGPIQVCYDAGSQ